MNAPHSLQQSLAMGQPAPMPVRDDDDHHEGEQKDREQVAEDVHLAPTRLSAAAA